MGAANRGNNQETWYRVQVVALALPLSGAPGRGQRDS